MRKKLSKRLPVPQKPPKVETPKKSYSRKRTKKETKRSLENLEQ